MQRARRWWDESSYLEDVAAVFTVVTVVNSSMMVVGWDTPKTGTFAYVHLLSRLGIVAAIMVLFHLADLRDLARRWSARDDGHRTRRPRRSSGRIVVDAVSSVVRRSPSTGVAAAFTILTVVVCLAAIASSPWREPVGGTALYGALLVLAGVLTVFVAAWASWFRS